LIMLEKKVNTVTQPTVTNMQYPPQRQFRFYNNYRINQMLTILEIEILMMTMTTMMMMGPRIPQIMNSSVR